MRGRFADQGGMFSYISPEARVPPNHPLRKIRALVREGRTDAKTLAGLALAGRLPSLVDQ